jgi:hypothetical protein
MNSAYKMTEHATGGVFKNLKTGVEYPYPKTWDHSAKLTAARKMEADDRAFTEAAAARAARPIEPDERSIEQRVREDGTIATSEPDHPRRVELGFEREIANLERKLTFARLPEDKARIRRLIDSYKEGLAQAVREREATEAETALRENPEYLRCLADAELEVETLSARPDIPQDFVDTAQANLKSLTESLDPKAYQAASKALTARYQGLRQSQVAELKARKAFLESELARTKRDEVPEIESPEAANL